MPDKKLRYSRTEKFEGTGHEYANCEDGDCPRAGAFRCANDHYLCLAHVRHDPSAKKMGRRCPICQAEIVKAVQDI